MREREQEKVKEQEKGERTKETVSRMDSVQGIINAKDSCPIKDNFPT